MFNGQKFLHYLNAIFFTLMILLTAFIIWSCIDEIIDMQNPEKVAKYPFGTEGPVTWNYASERVYLGSAKQNLTLFSQTAIASLLLYFSNRKYWANLVLILPYIAGFFFGEHVG